MVKRRRRKAIAKTAEPVEQRCLLTTLTVTTLADNTNANDGETSLREAIREANRRDDADRIVFAAGLTGTISLSDEAIRIEEPVEIVGHGQGDTVIDGGADRIFQISMFDSGPADFRIASMTLQNAAGAVSVQWNEFGSGSLEIDDVAFLNNTNSAVSSYLGGDQGPQEQPELIIRNSRFVGNAGTTGGAIRLVNGVSATIESSVFERNTATRAGGAIYTDNLDLADSIANGYPELTVSNSLFDDNSAEYYGGAIDVDGHLHVKSSTISNNTVTQGSGGGIAFLDNLRADAPYVDLEGPAIHIEATTLTGNTASGFGGAVHSGGGFRGSLGATIANSTIASNAARDGGGIYLESDSYNGTFAILNSTVAYNTASRDGGGVHALESDEDVGITIESTILAHNTAANSSPDILVDAQTFEFSHNLLRDNSDTSLAANGGTPDADGNLIGSSARPVDPLLGELTESGHVSAFDLQSGSPAIDAGSNTSEFEEDNRGRARVDGVAADIGAVEAVGDTTGPSVTLTNGKLVVRGTSDNDDVSARLNGAFIDVVLNGDAYQFDDADVEMIEVLVFDGDDNVVVALLDQPTLLLGGDGGDTIKGGTGNDTIRGGRGADSLRGTRGDDMIFGEQGKDTLEGQLGNDTLSGGSNNDRLFGDEDHDVLDGGDGNNYLNGGDGDDTLEAAEGDDLFVGGGGNDVMDAGDGNNRLRGGGGNDVMSAGAGNDKFGGGSGADRVDAGLGDNYLNGGNGSDTLTSGSGEDTLLGRGGDDVLVGGSGSDVIKAEKGNDILYGGYGNDSLFAGGGDDLILAGFLNINAAEAIEMLSGPIHDEWTSDHSFSKRTRNVRGGSVSSDRLNGDSYIKGLGRNEQNISDDQGDADSIRGGTGLDFFYASLNTDTLDNRDEDRFDSI